MPLYVIHEMYIVHRLFKLVGWYPLTALILWTILFLQNYHDDVMTCKEESVHISGNYIHTPFKYKVINNNSLDITQALSNLVL